MEKQKTNKRTPNVSTEELSTEAVVTEYVDIVNEAISSNSDSWPMGKMIELGNEVLDGRNFGVAVYRDDAGSTHDFYTMKFDGGRLRIVDHGKQDPSFTWKASEDYLRGVLADRDEYIANPAKLDFDWLKDRTGLN